MAKDHETHLAFDPILERVVTKREATGRIEAKLSDNLTWCFCDLCGNLTEYSAIRFNTVAVKKMKN